MADWSEKLGVPHSTLAGRIERGWSVEKTLSTPSDDVFSNCNNPNRKTKSDCERVLNESPLESLPKNFQKRIKEWGLRGTRFGTFMREMYRKEFDAYFKETFAKP